MIIATLLAAALVSAPPMVVTPDIAPGTVITKKMPIKVLVQSDSIVTQVEFYVDDDLRDTATATPYMFTIDPLIEKDGDEKLTFTAYNTEGTKASKSVMVKVDSGASKGAEANTKTARELMADGKLDDAMYGARLALKANPDYIPAQLLLSHIFLRQKVYDKAQEFAEDALRSDPNLPEGLELMATIDLERAFNSYSTGESRVAFMNSMSDAIESAILARKKLLDMDFDKLPQPNGANALEYGKTAIASGHYSAAISAITPELERKTNTALGNLMGYAQLRLGRFNELEHTLHVLNTSQSMDGYSYALRAMLFEVRGNTNEADNSMREAILQSADSLGVQTAQAYIALRRGNLTTLQGLAANFQKNEDKAPEVDYYLTALLSRLGRQGDANEEFQTAVLAEPLMFEVYIEAGNEAVARALNPRETADNGVYDSQLANRMYRAALEAKGDSVVGLTATAILQLLSKQYEAARKSADAATSADPDYAAAFYADSSIHSLLAYQYQTDADNVRLQAVNGVDPETQTRIDQILKNAQVTRQSALDLFAKAQKLDPTQLAGSELPRSELVFPYFYKYGMLPVISPP